MVKVLEPGDRDYKFMPILIMDALNHAVFWLRKKGLTTEEIRIFFLAWARGIKDE
jgi:hypothetical protein